MDATDDNQQSPQENQEDDGPACQSCRKRKLRCSREHPACTHCLRLDLTCVYDAKRNKPGIKAGVIDSLSRRIDALEETISRGDNSSNTGSSNQCQGHNKETTAIYDILSFFAREFKKSNNPTGPGPSPRDTYSTQQQNGTPISPWPTFESQGGSGSTPDVRTNKRRRLDSCGNPEVPLDLSLEDITQLSDQLPAPDLMDAIITAYFTFVQPWIPVLHETRFRTKLNQESQRREMVVILHAMTVAALRFVDSNSVSPNEITQRCRRSRNLVVLTAMDSLSVENLQALIIIAFVDMGSGNAPRAWPIIGSLTRTVEYLQLSIEAQDYDKQPLLRPLNSLRKAENWTEDEERRRVFWNIFIMDRFCSVTTGWNTSLTADDVHRRLPADGGLWHKEKAVATPYFGIWDKASAKIGKSIAFMPAHYPSPEQSSDGANQNLAEAQSNEASVDMSTVGAFAYFIEATESLSRVTTYFLQQKVNLRSRQEVISWLTRFKELDLRLVHWKMFLPERWKDSNVSRDSQRIEMDPNLTLAHLTHNASMILLHSKIAFPSPDWTEIVKLPSFCSAETCHNAAVEVANITQKYLKFTSPESFMTSQFAFCVFVSARVLLVHSKHYNTQLSNDFWTLVESLEEMSRKWCGTIPIPKEKRTDLAAKYARQLRDLYQNVISNPNFCIDAFGYPGEVPRVPEFAEPRPNQMIRHPSNPQSHSSLDRIVPASPVHERQTYLPDARNEIFGGAMQPGPQMLAQHRRSSSNAVPHGLLPRPLPPGMGVPHATVSEAGSDELVNISHALLGQQFMEMDRVITYDDGMFAVDMMSPAIEGWHGHQVNALDYRM